jgi:hypothetical protein
LVVVILAYKEEEKDENHLSVESSVVMSRRRGKNPQETRHDGTSRSYSRLSDCDSTATIALLVPSRKRTRLHEDLGSLISCSCPLDKALAGSVEMVMAVAAGTAD